MWVHDHVIVISILTHIPDNYFNLLGFVDIIPIYFLLLSWSVVIILLKLLICSTFSSVKVLEKKLEKANVNVRMQRRLSRGSQERN